MLIIGSFAEKLHGMIVNNNDYDFIGTEEEFAKLCNYHQGDVVIDKPELKVFQSQIDKLHYEVFIVGHKDSDQMLVDKYATEANRIEPLNGIDECYLVPISGLLTIKLAHRYKRNTPHFYKTMVKIRVLRRVMKNKELDSEEKEILRVRQRESLNYKHPKLDVTKKAFFDDAMNYVYDHDSIHEAIALTHEPAYKSYIKDNSEVLTSREKFESCPIEIRLAGVYEEACVLALERSQIPNDFKIDPRRSFFMALEKVCTSITSGWFREFAWENYETVKQMYNVLGNDDYVTRFNKNKSMLRPFK